MMPDNKGFSSDLAVLNERCIKNGLPSLVKFTQNGRPYIEDRIHIDLCEVFKKQLVKGTIFKNKYRTLKLQDVCQALLSKGKYGSGVISGANVHALTIDEQKQYVLQDAQLVMDLSKANDGQIMSLMQAISELTRLSLEQVCHSSLSTWWTKVFDDMGCVPPVLSRTQENTSQLTEYQGGLVIEPKCGLYRDLKIVDVVSLYPSVAILHNISIDTVNCACCINREDAKVPADVIDKGYWICKQKEGAFPKKLHQFKEERVRQKQLGNEEKQLGLKILINGGYGLFGNSEFKYADIRVAELITAFGRHTLRYMQDIASGIGFSVIAGDTDSLFLQGGSDNNGEAIQQFIVECKERIGVDVEHSQTFVKAAIIKKKHYFGVTTNGEIKAVGMEGKKNDRPAWINKVFDQFLEDFKADRDLTVNLRAAVKDLENGNIDPELLKIRVKLTKDPTDYAVNNPNKKIGILLGAKAGDIIWYFKTDKGVSINPDEISILKYKEMLIATVKDALEVLGYGSSERIESEEIFDRLSVHEDSDKASNGENPVKER
jgi:DNA polymerase elongation subunit (family B)